MIWLRTPGCTLFGHPGVEGVTSGCRKPEDGGVSEHFCLLSALFLLVFCKKVSYVDEITFLQMYIDMFPSVFETIPAICFNVRESDTSVT